ncbi:MAG: class I SAM-dependent methyltransferase [Oscillospiraceae bacterium]|nr:class I SAM-dependent methyltransferase [Oscillospiraceae bacterium]
MKRLMKHNTMENTADTDHKFDDIAQNIFFPIYPVIADDIIFRTKKTKGRMIDVGCGGGHLGFALMEKTECRGWFVDTDESALLIAENRAQERGLAERAVFLRQDVHCMEFPDNFADLIISRGSCCFWDDLEKALLEIYRVLAPGGRTYIGGGLGSKELAASIYRKMQTIIPGWPEQINRRSEGITDELLGEILDRNGILREIVNNETKDRWIIMRK